MNQISSYANIADLQAWSRQNLEGQFEKNIKLLPISLSKQWHQYAETICARISVRDGCRPDQVYNPRSSGLQLFYIGFARVITRRVQIPGY
jgi:hypothetical protein